MSVNTSRNSGLLASLVSKTILAEGGVHLRSNEERGHDEGNEVAEDHGDDAEDHEDVEGVGHFDDFYVGFHHHHREHRDADQPVVLLHDLAEEEPVH